MYMYGIYRTLNVVTLQELYHETYDSICVIFASIPNFWDFFRQNTISRHGIECIKILNELISDFDQVTYAY